MVGLFSLLALGLAMLWLAGVVSTAWMLTHPARRMFAWAVSRGRAVDPAGLEPARPFESWTFRSRGRDLPVWDIRGDAPDGPTVILTHGWADCRIGGLLRVGAIAPHASRVILWDLPGHGEAPGACGLGVGEVEDLRALLELLRSPRRQPATSPERERAAIVLYGWSLGAGVSIVVAAEDAVGERRGERAGGRIAGVIAESPYRRAGTPARNVLRLRGLPYRATLRPALWVVALMLRSWPLVGRESGRRHGGHGAAPSPGRPSPRGLARLPFDRAAHGAHLACPLLVVHGTADDVCPIEDGYAIVAAAPRGEVAEIVGARHNDVWTTPAFAAAGAQAVGSFLARLSVGIPAESRGAAGGIR